MKNIHLEMIRVTEAAAIAAAKLIGCGDKNAIDHAATEAMRCRLNGIDFAAKCILSEGEKDKAPMLANGEWVGQQRDRFISALASEPECQHYMKQNKHYELAVDAVDGTTQVSRSGYEAVSVLAIGESNCFKSIEAHYMQKLAVGPKVCQNVEISISDPVEVTIQRVAKALDKDIRQVAVCVLDRPRHTGLIQKLRELGCVVRLILDCDVTAAIATCMPDNEIDILLGCGGVAEGSISASALKCLGGCFQCRVCNNNGELIDPAIYTINDLVRGSTIFCATGITEGRIVKRVQIVGNKVVTNSILLCSENKDIRFFKTVHSM